jgi:hypothetical protein
LSAFHKRGRIRFLQPEEKFADLGLESDRDEDQQQMEHGLFERELGRPQARVPDFRVLHDVRERSYQKVRWEIECLNVDESPWGDRRDHDDQPDLEFPNARDLIHFLFDLVMRSGAIARRTIRP